MMDLALSLPFDVEKPVWLWAGLLIPLVIVASLRSLAGLDTARRVLTVTIRSVLLFLLVFCLAGLVRVRRNQDLTVMFLMDRSHSVESLQQYQEDYVREAASTMHADDRMGVIDFARDAFLEQLPMRGGFHVPPGRLAAIPNTDRTNVAAAIRLGMAMFPHDAAKRIVLLSDGNDNMSDVLSEARRASADGIPIDVVPLWYERRNEVYVDRLMAPTYAEPGEQVPIRMIVHSHRRASGTVTVYQNGRLLDIPADRSRLELKPGANTFVIKVPVDSAGAHTFEATFRADDESMDATPINNTGSTFTFVSGAGKVLLVSADPSYDAPLADALRREKVLVEIKTPAELGEFSLLQMVSYSAIILANIPAATFTDEQQTDLARYVKDLGSGLLMLGGDEAFGAGGWISSPVEEVMPVSFEIKHKRVIPRGALVLIMHSCEIPRGNFWGKEMAKKSVDTVSSQDYVGVLAYTYSPGGENWEVPLDVNTNRAAVKARIDRMQIGDMPDFGRTMEMAYKELTSGRGRDAAQKHVIILSDGDAQPPPLSLLDRYVEAKITVSTIGIGWGAHVIDRELKLIAVRTGGRFHAPRNPKELPQIFVKESKVVRRPLLIEEPFRPALRQAYSELLGTIDPAAPDFPPLGGMVLTSAKQNPNVVVPLVRATDDGDDPLLAHWQCELGKTVAFTSGFWPRWGKSWTDWPKFAKFWAQIVRWTMRQDTPANFDTFARIEGNRGHIVIDALDKDAGYLNFLSLQARVIGPNQQVVPLTFAQTGPGHYEADWEVENAGQYLTNVHVFTTDGKNLGTIRTGLTVPFSPEYRDLTTNESILRQIADLTGGRWIDVPAASAELFQHDLPPTEARQPVWDWLLGWVILPMFLLDVSVRRLASWLAVSIAAEAVILVVLLFGLNLRFTPWWGVLGAFLLADLIGWIIRFRYIGILYDWITAGVMMLTHTGERSTAALSRLRGTRDRVREEMSSEASTAVASVAEVPVASSVAGRKFEGVLAEGAPPVQNLSEALGGASAASPAGTAVPPAGVGQSPSADAAETTTSRLLKARRRSPKEGEKPE